MDRVFVYWDNSNIFHDAQRLAEEREGTPDARYLIRIHFESLLRLAEAGRPLAKAVAAGSVPPETPAPRSAKCSPCRVSSRSRPVNRGTTT